MVLVHYAIQGMEEHPSTFEMDKPLTRERLQKVFPFQGKFHFRMKQRCERFGYVWGDAFQGRREVTVPRDGRIWIKALPLSFDESECESTDLESDTEVLVEDELCRSGSFYRQDTPNRKEAKGSDLKERVTMASAAGGSVVRDISEGIKQVNLSETAHKLRHQSSVLTAGLGRMLSGTAAHLKGAAAAATGRRVPSPAALEYLHELADELGAKFESSNDEHNLLLESLWTAIFPDASYKREGAHWSRLGLSGPKPGAELGGSGVLALRALTFFATQYPSQMRRVANSQAGGGSDSYPVWTVGVNCALMLADVLSLAGDRFASSAEGHWRLFEQRDAFYELYCLVYLRLDCVWRETSANRSQFGRVMKAVKLDTQQLLQAGPASIDDLRRLAGQMGILAEAELGGL